MSRQLIRAPKKRPIAAMNEAYVRDVQDAARLTNGTSRFGRAREDEDERIVDDECCPACGDYTGDGERCSFCADDEDEDCDENFEDEVDE